MNHFQKYLVEEFAEDYQEGLLTRREALKLIASVTGSLLMAGTILSACAPAEELTASLSPEASHTPAASATQPAAGAAATATSPAPSATSPAASATPASPTSAPVGTVSADDPAVQAEDVKLPGDGAELMAYLARPSGDGSAPVILVCHENRGLTEHIKDITRRLAKAGYVALAMDLLSRQGGTTAFPKKA